jgi:TPR repeat protein
VPQDYAEAAKWYRLAASQGDVRAQNSLGLMYSDGEGASQDFREALKWYRLAAEQGHPAAQYSLGSKYNHGRGAPRNYVTAYAWLNVAVASGYRFATELRSTVEESMTPAQIAEAQQLSTEIFERIQQGSQ